MEREHSVELTPQVIRAHQKGHISDEVLKDPKKLNATINLHRVFRHEVGHKRLVHYVGAQFLDLKVQDETSGYTAYRIQERNLRRYLEMRSVIAYGGKMAEEVGDDHDHSGCGSDMFTVEHMAQRPGFGYLMSYGEGVAASVLYGIGQEKLDDEAWYEMRKAEVI